MKSPAGTGTTLSEKRWRCLAVVIVLGVPLLVGSDLPPEWSESRHEIESLFEKYRKSFPDVPVMTVEEYLNRRGKENLVLVDGRTSEERRVSMVPGAVSLNSYESRFDEYSGRDVVVYCTIGYRSAGIARELSRRGVRSYNLKGGVLSWAHANRTFIDGDGEGTRRVHVHGSRWNLLPKGYEAVW